MATYEELKIQFNGNRIPYSELLLTDEWRDKRSDIIERDKYVCRECNKAKTIYSQVTGLNYWSVLIREESVVLMHLPISPEPVPVTICAEYEDIPADKPYQLHVHHTYYILTKLPWEYPDESLQTLCNWCHHSLHQNIEVPKYKNELRLLHANCPTCERCGGAGNLPQYSYVQNGVCFGCDGRGFILPLAETGI